MLRSPEVSSTHAALAWTGDGWAVRDLGSRNGTFVGGERIQSGIDVDLKEGDVIAVGGVDETLTLTSADPPGPFATAGDATALGEGEMLPLPSADDPVGLVEYGSEDGWVALVDGAQRRIADGDTVRVAGHEWTVALPEAIVATVDVASRQATLAAAGLDFRVSADEEYVELTVRLPTGPVQLAPRAHHYPLLVLARAVLDDAGRGVVPAECGWVYVADLLKMLKVSSNQLNLSNYRARRELEGLGVPDAQRLVERRRTTHQVRLGVSDVTVSRL